MGPGTASPLGTSPACCLDSITSTVACDMDLAKYPMDEQECMLHLESCECRTGRASLPWGSGAGGQGLGPSGPCAAGLAQGIHRARGRAGGEGAGRPEQPGLRPMGQCPAYLGLGAQTTHLSASWGRGGSPLGHLAMAACMLASSSGPVRPAEVPGVAPGATMASAPARAGRPRRAAGGGGRGAVLPSGLSRRRLLVRGHRLLLV